MAFDQRCWGGRVPGVSAEAAWEELSRVYVDVWAEAGHRRGRVEAKLACLLRRHGLSRPQSRALSPTKLSGQVARRPAGCAGPGLAPRPVEDEIAGLLSGWSSGGSGARAGALRALASGGRSRAAWGARLAEGNARACAVVGSGAQSFP